MKQLITGIIVITGLVVLFWKGCTIKESWVTCQIKDHAVVANNGGVIYTTLVQCENGRIIDERSESVYLAPIGTIMKWKFIERAWFGHVVQTQP